MRLLTNVVGPIRFDLGTLSELPIYADNLSSGNPEARRFLVAKRSIDKYISYRTSTTTTTLTLTLTAETATRTSGPVWTFGGSAWVDEGSPPPRWRPATKWSWSPSPAILRGNENRFVRFNVFRARTRSKLGQLYFAVPFFFVLRCS